MLGNVLGRPTPLARAGEVGKVEDKDILAGAVRGKSYWKLSPGTSMFSETSQAELSSGRVRGELKGQQQLFVPVTYSQKRKRYLRSFYEQNHYIGTWHARERRWSVLILVFVKSI